MRRVAAVFSFFVLIAVGCGGKVSTESSSGGAGGVSATGGGPNGGSGGSVGQSCSGFDACCLKACDLAKSLPCSVTPPDAACGCGVLGIPQDCEASLTALYACVVEHGVGVLSCDQSGQVFVRCGFCDAEFAGVNQACGQISCQG